jgi:iron complex transport system permease protein
VGVALVVLATTGTIGAALVSGLGIFGQFSVAVAATLGAGAVMALVLLVARKVQSPVTLLIIGLMFGYATSAIVSLMLYFSIAERIQAYVIWTFGSFGGVTWGQLTVLVPIILAALALAYVLAKPLNALLLGEAYARTMGVNVQQARLWIIVSSALLAGTVTAFCGPIGFLGVAVPHLCRSIIKTSDHRLLIPAVVLMGAVIALIADLIAQVPGSQVVLPLNAVTALVGAPVVIVVILRRRNLRAAFAA